MIQFNRKTKRSKRKFLRLGQQRNQRIQVKAKKNNTQAVLNNILWKIIKKNGGTMHIPLSELADIPKSVTFAAYPNGDKITIVAGTMEPAGKSPLVLPD